MLVNKPWKLVKKILCELSNTDWPHNSTTENSAMVQKKIKTGIDYILDFELTKYATHTAGGSRAWAIESKFDGGQNQSLVYNYVLYPFSVLILHWSHVHHCQEICYPTSRVFTLIVGLTHWGRDKMAAIFQTTFSNVFSWMKMYEFQLKFH